eukprot:TRINITY_DN996_c0_g1_i10.p1 TRINITY_DN996_c0_g1~~TRINITY_DN996_c0_g1_i10.p1  ORF type:complete len:254 (+),score=7.12 TRINITY_DN996_c0_g1_i10:106-867(+)
MAAVEVRSALVGRAAAATCATGRHRDAGRRHDFHDGSRDELPLHSRAPPIHSTTDSSIGGRLRRAHTIDPPAGHARFGYEMDRLQRKERAVDEQVRQRRAAVGQVCGRPLVIVAVRQPRVAAACDVEGAQRIAFHKLRRVRREGGHFTQHGEVGDARRESGYPADPLVLVDWRQPRPGGERQRRERWRKAAKDAVKHHGRVEMRVSSLWVRAAVAQREGGETREHSMGVPKNRPRHRRAAHDSKAVEAGQQVK